MGVKFGFTARLLIGNSCEHLIHGSYHPAGVQAEGHPRTAARPVPSGASWTDLARLVHWSIYEVWVSSTGVYGHLPSSLSHWGLSAVLMELILARLSVVDVIMFFRKDRAQREGRRCAHPLIKTAPECMESPAKEKG